MNTKQTIEAASRVVTKRERRSWPPPSLAESSEATQLMPLCWQQPRDWLLGEVLRHLAIARSTRIDIAGRIL